MTKLRISQLAQSGAADGDVATWDDTAGEWVPAAGGGGGSLTVQDENGNVATGVTQIDFQGAGVVASAGTGEVIVTVSSGGGSGYNPIPVDDPANWTADLGYDYEFDASSSSLPTGWSWVNQGSATYLEAYGAGVINHPGPAGATDDIKGIVRNLPTETTWTATAKVRALSKDTNFMGAGLCLQESSSGKLVTFASVRTGRTVDSDKWTNPTTFSAALVGAFAIHEFAAYISITRNSDGTYTHKVSPDGCAWFTVGASSNVASFLTPDKVGFYVLRNGATPIAGSIHFFRVR